MTSKVLFHRSSPLPAGFFSLLAPNRWSRSELERFRNRQMRRLLRHAYEKIAFYRKLFEEAGIKPTDIRTLEDLPAIPVTVKRDLQAERPEDLTAAGLDPGKNASRYSGASPKSCTNWPSRSIRPVPKAFPRPDSWLSNAEKRANLLLERTSPEDFSKELNHDGYEGEYNRDAGLNALIAESFNDPQIPAILTANDGQNRLYVPTTPSLPGSADNLNQIYLVEDSRRRVGAGHLPRSAPTPTAEFRILEMVIGYRPGIKQGAYGLP